MKYFILALAALSACMSTATPQTSSAAQEEPRKEAISSLISEALRNNPELAAEAYRIEASQYRIPQASALADPELTFKLMEIPGTDFSNSMYANVELMQMVMFPTKLSVRREIASAQTDLARNGRLEKVLDVVEGVKSAAAMLWFSRVSFRLNADDQMFLRAMRDAAQTLYTVGRASQQEVLKIGIELTKLEADEALIRQDIVAAESMLRSLLARPSNSAIGEIGPPTLVPHLPEPSDLVAFALRTRPTIVQDSLAVHVQDLTIDLMRQEFLPDFKFAIEYVRMPALREDRWSIAAGITLPFAPWTLLKATSRVQESKAELQMRSSMLQDSKNMLESRIIGLAARVGALEERIRSFRQSIIPQSQQSLQSLLTDYQTGKTSFLMLLDAFRMNQELRMGEAMTLMNYGQTLARLEKETGVVDIQLVASTRKESQR